MTKNRRRIGHVRGASEEDGQHYVTLQIITPGVVDDYGSVWQRDTFDRSLQERLPTLAWGHDWKNPIGRAVDYETTDQGPVVRFRLDDFDAVPEARRAYAQVQSGTIDDCSVGFSNVTRRDRNQMTKEERDSFGPKATEIIEDADLDETSLVLRGAVPGAKVLAVRSKGGGTVDQSFVIELARQVAAGELSQEEASIAIDLATEADPDGSQGGQGGDGGEVPADSAELVAEIDAVLADRSRI